VQGAEAQAGAEQTEASDAHAAAAISSSSASLRGLVVAREEMIGLHTRPRQI
jgi:hypothetical protein